MQSINILIADDHELVGESISFLLSKQSNLQIVGIVKSGNELIRFLDNSPTVDIVLLDIEMPHMDGVDASKIIRRKFPETKILILSMHIKNSYVQALSAIGVQGYLHKDASIDTLLKAIIKITSGETYFDNRVIDSLLEIQKNHHLGELLSSREKEVLQLVAHEHTNKEISNILNVAPSTVDFHRRKIYEKTGLKNTAGLTKYAIMEGIINLS